jgi:DNA polymerase-3 subunit delta
MKLSYFQLPPHLKNKLLPVYVVSGEEELLKDDAIQLIRQSAKNAGMSERTRLTPESASDWEDLYPSLFATSLLADKRLIELDMRHSTPNKSAATLLCDYIKQPSADQILIINIGKADAKISKNPWYIAAEKTGALVTIWPVPRDQLPKWVIERAKRHNITLTSDAANVLSDFCEGNLASAAQAIEKLVLLNVPQPVNGEIIMKALHDESHFTIFDFIDGLIAGDKSRALHILDTLKADGIDPILVLWVITRELRMLATMAADIKSGVSYESLYQKHRIFARKQSIIRRFLSMSSEENCQQLLATAATIDKIIKGAAKGDAWQNLQLFCLRLV